MGRIITIIVMAATIIFQGSMITMIYDRMEEQAETIATQEVVIEQQQETIEKMEAESASATMTDTVVEWYNVVREKIAPEPTWSEKMQAWFIGQ